MELSGCNDIYPYILYSGFVNRETCPPTGTPYKERTVKWYELELILWGEGYIVTNGKKIPATKGKLFYRTPGMRVQGFSPYYCYLIVFDMFYDTAKKDAYSCPEYLDFRSPADSSHTTPVSDNPLDLPDVMDAKQSSRLEALFASIHRQFITERNNQFLLRAYLFEILAMAHLDWSKVKVLHKSGRSARNNYPRVMKVKEYIDNHPTRRFRLGELAGMAGLSPNFLCKVFKDIIGMGLVDYIHTCRMNMAKTALLNTNKAVKEISIECGYENECYFYTIFKRMEGISPSQFRDRYRYPNS